MGRRRLGRLGRCHMRRWGVSAQGRPAAGSEFGVALTDSSSGGVTRGGFGRPNAVLGGTIGWLDAAPHVSAPWVHRLLMLGCRVGCLLTWRVWACASCSSGVMCPRPTPGVGISVRRLFGSWPCDGLRSCVGLESGPGAWRWRWCAPGRWRVLRWLSHPRRAHAGRWTGRRLQLGFEVLTLMRGLGRSRPRCVRGCGRARDQAARSPAPVRQIPFRARVVRRVRGRVVCWLLCVRVSVVSWRRLVVCWRRVSGGWRVRGSGRSGGRR